MPYTIEAERERVRCELNRLRMAREAGAIESQLARERAAEREAKRATLADITMAAANRADREARLAIAAAHRRDALTRALDYPLTGAELIDACQHATLAARVPAESFEDVSQALVAHVIRRHGPNPIRARVGAAWLRQRALAIHLDQRRELERATGARAAAEQLADWRAADHRAAMADAAQSGDLVWNLAAHRPAPAGAEPIAPETIARRLGLSAKLASALAVAINTRRIRPLTAQERDRWREARAAIRRQYPDVQALLIAMRPESYAAELLTDAAIRAERKRAAIASRVGSHVGARVIGASSAPLARFRRVAP